jgi:hypothetical protein
LDRGAVDLASLGIRTAEGRLVVADAVRVYATLFGEPTAEFVPRSGTRRIVLYAVAVEGVPAIHVEEALWVCTDLMGAG